MGWIERPIGEVLELEYGKPLAKELRTPDGSYAAYGANGEKCRTNQAYHVEPSIIVGRKGSAGEVTLVDKPFWPLDVTFYVKFNRSCYDLKFLFLTLKFLDLPSLAKGVKPGINRNDVYALRAKFPPLEEQKRIVAILDQAFEGIDKAIANTEQNLKNALELFDGHLRKTFSALEADWPQEKFEEIVQNSLVGLVKNSKEQGPDLDYPYVKMNNITADGRFDSAKLTYVNASMEDTRRYALQDGDFLFNTRNSAELVGKNCIFKPSTSKPMLFNNNIMRIRFKPKADAIFVAYAFRAPNVKSQLEAFVSGTTNVAAIYQKQLRTLKLVLPSLPVQKSTSQALHKASGHVKSLTAGYDRKIELLSELKQSLLQKAFSGELTNTDRQEAAKVA